MSCACPVCVRMGSGDGCWDWPLYRNAPGYGKARVEGRTRYVHRIAYAHQVGPIPEGMEVDHLCRNPACFNPAHLEVVTPEENKRRRLRKTHCKRGHAFTEANTTIVARTGERRCRTCHANRERARRAALTYHGGTE